MNKARRGQQKGSANVSKKRSCMMLNVNGYEWTEGCRGKEESKTERSEGERVKAGGEKAERKTRGI